MNVDFALCLQSPVTAMGSLLGSLLGLSWVLMKTNARGFHEAKQAGPGVGFRLTCDVHHCTRNVTKS